MPEATTLIAFAGTAMILFILPGPAVVYIVTRSLSQGRTAGLVSVAGIHVGSAVHIVAAAIGLSALIAASATAFTAIRWLGAAYLIYLGLRTLLSGGESFTSEVAEPSSYRRVFAQGIIVNVLNPKVALFFLAFVPQFVDPALGSTTLQVAVLGVVFVIAGVISDGIYAFAAGSIGDRLMTRPRWKQASRYGAGAVYLSLGTAAAFSGVGTD
ncbi:MAG: LysE family translocator [Actinomycetota bacterium]